MFSFPIGVGFNKADRALTEQFNAFLAQLKADGTLKGILDRWVIQRDWKMPDIAIPQGGKVLRVGIAGTGGAPFDFIQDNEIVGVDVETSNDSACSAGVRCSS